MSLDVKMYIFLLHIGLQLSVWRITSFPLPLMFGPLESHYMRSSLTATLSRALQRYWFNGISLLCGPPQNSNITSTLLLVLTEIYWNVERNFTNESGGSLYSVGEAKATALSQKLPAGGNPIRLPFGKHFDQWLMLTHVLLCTQVRMIMEQCWATEPQQRPAFISLIEKFERMCWKHEGNSCRNSSLAQVC